MHTHFNITIGRFLLAVYYVTNTPLAVNDAVSNSKKEGAGQQEGGRAARKIFHLEIDGVRNGQGFAAPKPPR